MPKTANQTNREVGVCFPPDPRQKVFGTQAELPIRLCGRLPSNHLRSSPTFGSSSAIHLLSRVLIHSLQCNGSPSHLKPQAPGYTFQSILHSSAHPQASSFLTDVSDRVHCIRGRRRSLSVRIRRLPVTRKHFQDFRQRRQHLRCQPCHGGQVWPHTQALVPAF